MGFLIVQQLQIETREKVLNHYAVTVVKGEKTFNKPGKKSQLHSTNGPEDTCRAIFSMVHGAWNCHALVKPMARQNSLHSQVIQKYLMPHSLHNAMFAILLK